MKRDVAPGFVNQVCEGNGNREVSNADEGIRGHMSPHQRRTAEIAEHMREVIIRPEEAHCKPRPEQERAKGNDGPNRDEVNQSPHKWRGFKKIGSCCS